MAKYGMVIDLDRCVGCQACMVACKAQWQTPEDYFRTWVKHIGPIQVKDEMVFTSYVGQCNHCDNPPCVPACPTQATFKDTETGIVLVDYDLCIGCGYCVEACPYDARFINPVTKKVEKCDFCFPRLGEEDPACVKTCIVSAKVFGDLENKDSYISKKISEGNTYVIATKEVNPGPNVYYKGRRSKVEAIIKTYPPKKKDTLPAKIWSNILRPFVILGAGATFIGSLVAFLFQINQGEKEGEDEE